MCSGDQEREEDVNSDWTVGDCCQAVGREEGRRREEGKGGLIEMKLSLVCVFHACPKTSLK